MNEVNDTYQFALIQLAHLAKRSGCQVKVLKDSRNNYYSCVIMFLPGIGCAFVSAEEQITGMSTRYIIGELTFQYNNANLRPVLFSETIPDIDGIFSQLSAEAQRTDQIEHIADFLTGQSRFEAWAIDNNYRPFYRQYRLDGAIFSSTDF